MRLGLLLANGLVLAGIGWIAAFGSANQRSAPLMSGADMGSLESRAAVAPTTASVAALAGAYLDRDQPGLATAVLERAPREIRDRPQLAQLHARALFHRGQSQEALTVSREASAACADPGAPCPAWLIAATARQVAFLEELVAAGVSDPYTQPEATRAAYERSQREVRLVAMR